jgi:hypothetical protein
MDGRTGDGHRDESTEDRQARGCGRCVAHGLRGQRVIAHSAAEVTGTWSGPFFFTAIYVGSNPVAQSGCVGSLRLDTQGAGLSGYYQVNPPCTGEGVVTGTVAAGERINISLPGNGATNEDLKGYLYACAQVADTGGWVGSMSTVSVIDLTRTLGLNCPTSGRVTTMVEEFHGTRVWLPLCGPKVPIDS